MVTPSKAVALLVKTKQNGQAYGKASSISRGRDIWFWFPSLSIALIKDSLVAKHRGEKALKLEK